MLKKFLVVGVLAAVSLNATAQMNGGLYYSVTGLAAQAANTVLGNATSGSASPTALSMTSCSTAGSAVSYTSNTGFGCNTAVDAATLGAKTFASPAAIGSGTPAAGNFTTVGATGTVIVSGTLLTNSMLTSTALTANGAVAHKIIARSSTNDAQIAFFRSDGTTPLGFFTSQQNGLDWYGPSAAKVLGMTDAGISVVGTLLFPSLATSSAATTGTMCWTTGTGNVNVDTTTTCLLSGEQFKQNDRPLENGLKIVLALKPKVYTLKPEFNPTNLGEQLGFYAQDVVKVEPRLVSLEEDGSPHAVRYQQLTAALVNAIQQQQEQIDLLKKQVKSLLPDGKNQIYTMFPLY